MIAGYKDGANLSILDTFYQRSEKLSDGKYTKDFISILYKDNETGKKNHQVIEEPDYEYYMANDDIYLEHNLLFIPENNATKRVCKYKRIAKDIAEATGNIDFFNNNISNGNYRANQMLHTIPRVFNSDMEINDHYRFRFDKLYQNPTPSISKAYFDIEVDSINMVGDFPELGECPINAISYIYNGNIRSFLLRNPNNPLIEKFEKSIGPALFKELQEFIIENVGGIDRAKKFKLDKLGIEFLFYDHEIELIEDLFKTINQQEPDFLLAWNMAFDIPYIIERLYELGYNPKDIMCHPSFADHEKVAYYFIDEKHKNEYSLRGDKYTISSHTVYQDQLIHFASRRKGQAAFPDFKLDTAGSIIAKVRKLNYHHITTNIAKLPYLDYKTFVFYNIMDTIVQHCIEEEVQDINYVCGKCIVNNTRYDKTHRQTVYLTNRATKEFAKRGFIIGNNVNKFNPPKGANQDDDPEVIKSDDEKYEKYAGAIVTDPRNNSSFSKLNNLGQILNIMDNLVDFDFKSLYPSIAREHNMAPNTQIGKIIIQDKVHSLENPFNNPKYDRGGQFIEDLTSQNLISFCSRWLGFASFREWLADLEYYYLHYEMPRFNLYPKSNRIFTKFEGKPGLTRIFYYDENASKPTRIFTRITPKIDMEKHMNTVRGLK